MDLGDDLEIPPADTKAERRQSVGPTKARRKREAKQKRRLARIQVMSETLSVVYVYTLLMLTLPCLHQLCAHGLHMCST